MADDAAMQERAERRERLGREATDYVTLEAHLRALGVDGLIARLTEHEDFEYWYSDIPPVRRALVRGRAQLAADPGALPAVLIRYLWGEEDAVERLRTQAKARLPDVERPPWADEVTEPVDEIPHDSPWVESVLALPSGARAVVVGAYGATALVDPGGGAVLVERDAPPGEVLATGSSLAGGWLYVADVGGRVVRRRVDADGLAEESETVLRPDETLDLDERPGRVALAVAALPNGRHLLTGCVDGAVRLVDLASGRTVWTGRHDGAVNALTVTPDGRLAVSGGDDGAVRVWDVGTGREVQTLRGHARSVRAVAVTPDGNRIVSGSADRTARVWEDGDCVRVMEGAAAPGDPVPEVGPAPSDMPGHWRAVEALALTPDGYDLLTASADHTVRVWDVASGAETAVLAGHTGAVRALALGDGWILSGGHDRHLLVWDAVMLGIDTTPVPPTAAAPELGTTWTSAPNRLCREHDRALRWEDRASTTTSCEVVDGVAVQIQVDVTTADDVEAMVWTVVGLAPHIDVELTRGLARIGRRHRGVSVAVDEVFTGVGENVEQVVAAWWRGREDGIAGAVAAVAAAAAETQALLAAPSLAEVEPSRL